MQTSRRTFLEGVALASFGLAVKHGEALTIHDPHFVTSGAVASNLAQLLEKFRLGADYFLNGSATRETVQRDFRLMGENGFTLARIFVVWDDIERTQDVWKFEGYDWIFDSAQHAGVQILATLFPQSPPGWMDMTTFSQQWANLDDPHLRERSTVYLEKVVTRYRGHPALGAWLLMNEPEPHPDPGPATMAVFAKWLEAKYGTVEALNKRWFRPLHAFSNVKIPVDKDNPSDRNHLYFVDYNFLIDWSEFNYDRIVQILEWIGGIVRKLDTVHPTHINPIGGNFWEEAKTVDFLGASIHPAWSFDGIERDDFGLAFAYRLDVLASAAGAKPWFVTELQGGPTIFTGLFSMNPTAGELTRWLWDTFGAGGRGACFWLWNPRDQGREAGEWQLVSEQGVLSDRIVPIKKTFEAANRVPFLADAVPSSPKVALLYNYEAMRLCEIDGQTQHRSNEPGESLMGCYQALRRRHVPAVFVDVEQLKSGEASRYDILYLPYSYAMDEQAVSALREFVQRGGTVWADGLVAWKNEYGDIRPSLPGGLSDLFGWKSYVADIDPVEKPYSVTMNRELGGELWNIPLELHGASAILTRTDGSPFATEHRFGKGRVIYYGAAVSLAYSRRGNSIVGDWIAEPAMKPTEAMPVHVVKASERVGFRALDHSSGSFAILTNWGGDDSIQVCFRGDYTRVVDLLGGAALAVTRSNQNTFADLTLPGGGVCVLKASNR